MQLEISSLESAAVETQIKHRLHLVPRTSGVVVIAKLGRVRVHLDVPSGKVTIDKQNTTDLSRAIDEAFAATRIKLEEYVHKLRHDVKLQGPAPDVRVTTIFPPDGYGVLETLDGREVYFPPDRSAGARRNAAGPVS